MALTIGVDSFVSLADADIYWGKHSGGTNWASATDASKEAALREATQYIDKSFVWRGIQPEDEDQLLAWPRLYVRDTRGKLRDEDTVPPEIKDATSWLAEQALAGALLPAKNRGGRISRVKAGSVEVQYEDNAPSQQTFDYVNLLVSPLVKYGQGSTQLLKG